MPTNLNHFLSRQIDPPPDPLEDIRDHIDMQSRPDSFAADKASKYYTFTKFSRLYSLLQVPHCLPR
jgi:hypothetical protein